MKTTISIRDLFRCLCVALVVMFTLAVLARADEAPPPPPAPPEEKAVAPAEPEKSDLHRLDVAPEEKPAAIPLLDEGDDSSSEKPAAHSHQSSVYNLGVTRANHGERVHVMADTYVRRDETINGDVVAVMGDLTVDGVGRRNAVAVMGSNTVNGTVDGRATAVMGDVTVNGKVGRDVVAVMGDVVLGPKSEVDGNVTCVGGKLKRSPGAIVNGDIIEKELGDEFHGGVPLSAWWAHALMFGRALAIGPHLAWLWVWSFVSLALYALLALLFPAGIRHCGDTLAQRPMLTVLTGVLSLISLPLLCILMIITIVGILLLPFVPMVLLFFTLFGKASICALIGRLISRDRLHPSLAVLVGGVLLMLFYLVPFIGLPLSIMAAFLGFSCVMCRLFTQNKKVEVPAAPAPAAAFRESPVIPPVQASALAAPELPAVIAPVEPPPILPPPPVLPVAPASVTPPMPALPPVSLPRAGFWRRIGALFLDFVLIGIIFGPMGAGPAVIPFLAIYAAIMWTLKGTTIGGIICGVRVVRLDGRPVDWATAMVRALGCFLSAIVAGLGFIWIVFDPEKQSWHDKIAGTVVVMPPKGTSLL